MPISTDADTVDDPLLPIGKAAELAAVSVTTLRRWEKDGWITSVRTPTGQRRFRRSDILGVLTVRDDS